MFEQRRCQRGATREDKVRAVLRLDAANALDDVRPNALERAPFKTFRTVGSNEFRRRIEAVRHTGAPVRPEAGTKEAPKTNLCSGLPLFENYPNLDCQCSSAR